MNPACDRKFGSRYHLTLLFLVVVSILLYRGDDRYIDTGSYVSLRYQIIERLDNVVSLLKDEELALRDYLLTGKEESLKPITPTRARLVEVREEIFHEKTVGTDGWYVNEGLLGKESYLDLDDEAKEKTKTQMKRVKELKPLIDDFHANTDAVIEAAKSKQSDPSARTLLASDQRRNLFDSVRVKVDEIRAAEGSLLRNRLENVRESAAFLGDTVVFLHFVFIAIVVIGLPLILVGAYFRWEWTRNPWFRFTHLAMIMIVVAESLVGYTCPLTTWEHDLKLNAGLQASDGSFIGTWMHKLVIFDWIKDPKEAEKYFTMAYVAFGALVLAGLWLSPPRLCRKRSVATGPPQPHAES